MDYAEIILKTILEKCGPILTVDHLAKMLHLSPRSIRNQMYGENALRLPHGRRIGKRQYFAADDVAQWPPITFTGLKPETNSRPRSRPAEATPNVGAPARRPHPYECRDVLRFSGTGGRVH